MKKIIKLIFPLILLLFISCLDITISYRLNENGKLTSVINFTANNEYGYYMIPGMQENLISEGYTITNYSGKSVEGIIYTDISNALNNEVFNYENKNSEYIFSDLFSTNFKTDISNSGFKKIFTFNYEFPKKSELNESNISDYDYSELIAYNILSMFNISFIITVPGEIVETTGTIISSNTVKWEFNMFELLKNGGLLYLKTEIDKNPANILSAEKSTQKKILKIYEKIDELKFKTVQLEKMTEEQKELNKNINTELKKSDILLVELLNSISDDYFEINKKYASGLNEIKLYNKKLGFEEIPNPSSGVIIYNNQTHKFKIGE